MNKLSFAAGLAGVLAAGLASAASLTPGIYDSVGIVASNNGSANCAAVGLSQNASVTSVVKYPGLKMTGFTIYTVPFGGGLQLCNGFPAIPAGGLDGFSATAQCAIDTINGGVPAQPVMFAFTSTTTDANSSVGTTTVTIPATNAVGGGCSAVIDTTLARAGK